MSCQFSSNLLSFILKKISNRFQIIVLVLNRNFLLLSYYMMVFYLYIWERCCIRKPFFFFFWQDFQRAEFLYPLCWFCIHYVGILLKSGYVHNESINLGFFLTCILPCVIQFNRLPCENKPLEFWCVCCLQGYVNVVPAVQLYHDSTQFWCGTHYQSVSETTFSILSPQCEKECMYVLIHCQSSRLRIYLN